MTTSLLTDREVLATVSELSVEQRALDLRRVAIAGDFASRDELYRAAGFASAAHHLASLWAITVAEARRFVEVGLATRERVAIDGSPLPARYELLAAALPVLGVERTAIAVRELDVAHCSFAQRTEGEQGLVDHGPGFTVADFAVLARQVRDRLDQDGAEPRDYLHHVSRSLRITELSNGMTKVVWEMPPETAGLVRAGINAIVAADLRKAAKEGVDDERSFEQHRSDAATDIFRHAATCGHAGGDLPAFTMVIRMSLEELLTGAGYASIDGVGEGISASAARQLAGEAEFLPVVLNGHSEPLDYGFKRRLYSRSQKLVAMERDGGCCAPGCTAPAAFGEGHHVEWWSHGGKTDMSNIAMTCSFHHHLIHKGGWELEMREHVPYMIPPAWVDPSRTPRRGGRVVIGVA